LPGSPGYRLKATLYHAGARGVGALDSLGCKVVAMRTAAVDRTLIPRRTVLFIKETVGLPLPGGGVHDGYWYASDVGGAIKGERIDLFTGKGTGSMKPMMPLNLAKLSAVKVGEFTGCPPN
jgi:3D (Asp-Asp-Asp) domain-containing protein